VTKIEHHFQFHFFILPLLENWFLSLNSFVISFDLTYTYRFLRYDQGHFFSTHQDGTYIRKHEAGESRVGERSLITCQLYLNEGFIGGSTGFESYHDRNHLRYDVIPKMGSILLFEHGLNHEGATLIEGRKYVIRFSFLVPYFICLLV